jgi:hypothetical protein
MRIMGAMFPGREITDERPQLLETIVVKRNPNNLTPFELLQSAAPVGLEELDARFFAESGDFYLLYEHPVLRNRVRLFHVDKHELVHFLKSRIVPDRMEGIDVTVVTPDLRRFLICNHDGEMYSLDSV